MVYLAATLGAKAKPSLGSSDYRLVLRFGLPQKTSADLERHDFVAMQLEDVIEVHRTTRKIA
jgi:hypothetical protein